MAISLRTSALGFAVVLAVLVSSAPVAAQQQVRSMRRSLTLIEAQQMGLARTSIISGRLVVTAPHSRNMSFQAEVPGGGERLVLRSSGQDLHAQYEKSTAKEDVRLEIAGTTRAHLVRTPKGDSRLVPVEFIQPARGMVSLVVGNGDERQVYTAPSLWHLLMTEREVCGEHLLPLLAMVNDTWDLMATRDEIQEALIARAAHRVRPDREHWAALVSQLGHERFTQREAADRELRALGPAVAGYLQTLDEEELDAEQRFRIQRILLSFADRDIGDTPEQVALWLASDPQIWQALLDDEDESIRRVAAEQLKLLGEERSGSPSK